MNKEKDHYVEAFEASTKLRHVAEVHQDGLVVSLSV